MHIVDYLWQEARKITDAAPQGPETAEEWRTQWPLRHAQFLEWLGLTHLPPAEQRPSLNVRVTGTLERNGYRIEKLHYESLPRLYVAANLYVPTGTQVPAHVPAVLYLCGHSPRQKVEYQAHARRFAQLGFVSLIVDTLQYGEVFGYHCGTYRHGFWNWYSRGYTPAAVETWNAIRGLDLLQSLPYVDGNRLGATGISGGGSVSTWLAAADPRVACAAAVCSTGTTAGHVIDGTIYGHCDCVLWHNPYRWDQVDIAALIAPRPYLIASANRDWLFSIAAIREFHRRLAKVYERLDARDNLSLVETAGKHDYKPQSRAAVFAWFLRHLGGLEVGLEEVGDLDPRQDEPESALRVFTSGIPADDISTTIQDTFIRTARPPDLRDTAALVRHRTTVVDNLRRYTFAAFPDPAPALDFRVESAWETGLRTGCRFSFVSEEGWRIYGGLGVSDGAPRPAPTLVRLSRDVSAWDLEGEYRGLSSAWAHVCIEPRGTGRSGFGPDIAWYVRRCAALVGRTVASMRVWDTLRTLAAVRQMPEVDGTRLALAGQGEMAAVVLYAALLDGGVRTVILHDPPATQDQPGQEDGTGPLLEMLHCLRFTDLPQVAGLLYPAELVFLGPRPASYLWAEDLYHRLGGTVRHVFTLGEWIP